MPKKNKTKTKGKTKAIRRILSDDEGMDVDDTPPRVPGTSPLEQLPRHILYQIHFASPTKSLPATSKTIFEAFRPDNLPVAETGAWVAHLVTKFITDKLCESKPDRTVFILDLHFARNVHTIRHALSILHKKPGNRFYTITNGPCDPSPYLMIAQKTLPVDFVHTLYHTFPPNPQAMTATVRKLAGKYTRDEPLVKALLDCGADPRVHKSLHPGRTDPFIAWFKQQYNWDPKNLLSTECTCGWRAQPNMVKSPIRNGVMKYLLGSTPSFTLERFIPEAKITKIMSQTEVESTILNVHMLPKTATVHHVPTREGEAYFDTFDRLSKLIDAESAKEPDFPADKPTATAEEVKVYPTKVTPFVACFIAEYFHVFSNEMA